MTGAPQSPDFLGQPRRGVRRLNRAPLAIAFLVVCVILGALTYAHRTRLAEQRREAQQAPRPEPATLEGAFREAPDGGLILADKAPPPSAARESVEKPNLESPRMEAKEPVDELRAQRAEQRRQAKAQALVAPTALPLGPAAGRRSAAETRAAPRDASWPRDASSPHDGGWPRDDEAAEARSRGRRDAGGEDQARAKRRFLQEGAAPQGAEAHHLAAGREPPRSPFEVKAGTIIPAVMIGGVSSDLPGQIIGQVSENVCDTATGRYVLIPQGARLIGVYDNGVSAGQERVLVAWTRIVYPDASTLDLGKMPGGDQAGYGGFHDRVNDHFWRVFGDAVLLSLFSGGLQLSQGQSGADRMNAQQTLIAALGQQTGQLGMEMARRNMQIQPSLEIRPGYRFVVQVTKDIVVRPWRTR